MARQDRTWQGEWGKGAGQGSVLVRKHASVMMRKCLLVRRTLLKSSVAGAFL